LITFQKKDKQQLNREHLDAKRRATGAVLDLGMSTGVGSAVTKRIDH